MNEPAEYEYLGKHQHHQAYGCPTKETVMHSRNRVLIKGKCLARFVITRRRVFFNQKLFQDLIIILKEKLQYGITKFVKIV